MLQPLSHTAPSGMLFAAMNSTVEYQLEKHYMPTNLPGTAPCGISNNTHADTRYRAMWAHLATALANEQGLAGYEVHQVRSK